MRMSIQRFEIIRLKQCSCPPCNGLKNLSDVFADPCCPDFTVINGWLNGSLEWRLSHDDINLGLFVVLREEGADLRGGYIFKHWVRDRKDAYKQLRYNQLTVFSVVLFCLFLSSCFVSCTHAFIHFCRISSLCSSRFPQQPRRLISLGWQVCLSLHISATRAPSLHPKAVCSNIGPFFASLFCLSLPNLILAVLKVAFSSYHNIADAYFPSPLFPLLSVH